MPPHLAVDTVHYKVFICGRSGVGKTALAARLAGTNIPNTHYETKGTSLLHTDQAGEACGLEAEDEWIICFPRYRDNDGVLASQTEGEWKSTVLLFAAVGLWRERTA